MKPGDDTVQGEGDIGTKDTGAIVRSVDNGAVVSASPSADASGGSGPPTAGKSRVTCQKRKLSRKEKKARKKLIRAQGGDGTGIPFDFKDVYGEKATVDITVQLDQHFKATARNMLRVADVQTLLLWMLTDTVPCPKWVFVKNKPLIGRVVCLTANCIGDAILRHPTHFPFLTSIVHQPVMTRAPGDKQRIHSPLHTLMQVPLSKEAMKRRRRRMLEADEAKEAALRKQRQEEREEKEQGEGNDDNGDDTDNHEDVGKGTGKGTGKGKGKSSTEQATLPLVTHYTMTTVELEDNGYPPVDRGNDGDCGEYMQTRHPGLGPRGHRILALDCEMCVTTQGLELTRLSVVGEDDDTLLDEFVQPPRPIKDYNTRFSGITPQMLQGVTTTLNQVRQRLLDMMGEDTILVGHSLENDLHALRIVHHSVIDTSILYPHPRGPPYKNGLRRLSQKYLDQDIQQTTHDSVIDAQTCLRLVKLKVAKGPYFGLQNERVTESMFHVLTRQQCRSAVIGPQAVVRMYCRGSVDVDAIVADSVQDVSGKVVTQLRKEVKAPTAAVAVDSSTTTTTTTTTSGGGNGAGFIFATLNHVREALSQFYDRHDQAQSGVSSPDIDTVLGPVYRAIDDGVRDIWHAMRPNDVLCLLTLQGDYLRVEKLKQVVNNSEEGEGKSGLEEGEVPIDIPSELERARKALTCLAVKPY